MNKPVDRNNSPIPYQIAYRSHKQRAAAPKSAAFDNNIRLYFKHDFLQIDHIERIFNDRMTEPVRILPYAAIEIVMEKLIYDTAQ
jgi:hypothetical protein